MKKIIKVKFPCPVCKKITDGEGEIQDSKRWYSVINFFIECCRGKKELKWYFTKFDLRNSSQIEVE